MQQHKNFKKCNLSKTKPYKHICTGKEVYKSESQISQLGSCENSFANHFVCGYRGRDGLAKPPHTNVALLTDG